MVTSDIRHVIVALGAGMNAVGSIGLTTGFRALAAAALWHRMPGSFIIFSGGLSANGSLPEADAMREHVRGHPVLKVPGNCMETDTRSFDTASNIRNVVRIIGARQLPKTVTLIAGVRNKKRAAAYLRAYGIDVTMMTLREALGDHAASMRIPDDIDRLPGLWEGRHELFMRLLRIIDPRGVLVMRFLRDRRKLS